MCRSKLLPLLIFALAPASPALAQRPPTQLPCDAFTRKPDGSWESNSQAMIRGADGVLLTIMPGVSLKTREPYMGYDLATQLQQQCRAQTSR